MDADAVSLIVAEVLSWSDVYNGFVVGMWGVGVNVYPVEVFGNLHGVAFMERGRIRFRPTGYSEEYVVWQAIAL